MKIAVLSDTHNELARIRAAVAEIERRGIAMILHCGDIEDAAAARLFPAHTHFVFGNCDHDRDGLRQAIADRGATLHEPFGHVEAAGKNLAFTHGDDRQLLHDLEASEAFDYLFHGHTHVAAERRTGPTRVINPGALHRAAVKTFIVLDLETATFESIALP